MRAALTSSKLRSIKPTPELGSEGIPTNQSAQGHAEGRDMGNQEMPWEDPHPILQIKIPTNSVAKVNNPGGSRPTR